MSTATVVSPVLPLFIRRELWTSQSVQSILATIFVMKTYMENITKYIPWSQGSKRQRPWTDRTKQYASKEECIKWNK